MSGERVVAGKLKVAKVIYDLVKDEILPGTGIDVSVSRRGSEPFVDDCSVMLCW